MTPIKEWHVARHIHPVFSDHSLNEGVLWLPRHEYVKAMMQGLYETIFYSNIMVGWTGRHRVWIGDPAESHDGVYLMVKIYGIANAPTFSPCPCHPRMACTEPLLDIPQQPLSQDPTT